MKEIKNQFYHKIDLRNKKAMVDYLKNHFRYNTMNSWNKSTSYAQNLKIYNVVPNNLYSKAIDLLSVNDTYTYINILISDWDYSYNYVWQAGFNGRSGGYLVLYQGGRHKNGNVYSHPGKGVDQYEDFEDWDIVNLKERVKLIQDFDKLCDDIVAEFICLCENCTIETKEISELKTIKILKENE